jgi:alkylation response protein AidB-like acyl-CoA dehydrogenase
VGIAGPLLAELGDPSGWLAALVAGDVEATAHFEESTLVPFGQSADVLLLRRDDAVYLVGRDDVTSVPKDSVDGSRALADITFEPTAERRLIRDPAEVDRALDRGALGTAAQLIGLGRRMLDLTVGYVKERRQFGVPIGSFQAVKHHLADARIALEFARPLVYRAAWSVAQADPDRAVHVSMAKATASDAATLTAGKALQCHGAMGYSYEYDLHLYMKRSWALAAAWGSASWHRGRVGRAIL